MGIIKSIKAREILDSRGNPTIEVDIITNKGLSRAMVPSGASTGIHEAVELRDNDKKRYLGKGVLKAVNNVNRIISKKVIGMNPIYQKKIDQIMLELDGTKNKSKLGANAILAVSMAICRAGALEQEIPLYKHIAELSGTKKLSLPIPFCNIVNGGKHADNELAFQEFMIVPVKAKSFKEGIRMCAEVYHILKKDIHKRHGKGTTNIGDEGGFAPEQFDKIREPLNIITKAIEHAGYKNKVKIAMDAAASEFYRSGKYHIDRRILTKEQLTEIYGQLAKKYPIVSIEDPFYEEDFESFRDLTKKIGKKVQIVGDDLLVTNPERIKIAIEKKACNTLLLKVNQIGSVTESIEACKLAQSAGWNVMVSHRSGETTDSFIADLVVGLNTGQIKSGAPCRGERLAKYNQLIRIEEELGKKAVYGK